MKTVENCRLAGSTLLLMALLAGCGGGDAPPASTDSGAAAPAAGDPPSGTQTMDTPSPGPVRVTFEPIAPYLAEGGITLRRADGMITADILADSHLGPGDYPIHIHEGRCADGGRVVVQLTTMTGGEGGEGSSLTTFPEAQLPLTGTYFIQMHRIDGTPIGCGDVPPLTNL